MAIYHLSVKPISRSAGRSSVASAAYRSGDRLTDPRTGLTWDYRRKRGVDYSSILAPKGAPDWMRDRQSLWGSVEQVEKRKDARTSREFEVALPVELSPGDRVKLAEAFSVWLNQKGMVVDLAIHHQGGQNPHAHMMATTRVIDSEDGDDQGY